MTENDPLPRPPASESPPPIVLTQPVVIVPGPPAILYPNKCQRKQGKRTLKAEELLAQGMSVADIAKKFKVTPACVYRWLKFGEQRHPNQRFKAGAVLRRHAGQPSVAPEFVMQPLPEDAIEIQRPDPGVPIPPLEEVGAAQKDEVEETDKLIGMPLSSWTPTERSYIEEREQEIMVQLGQANRGSARPFLNEVINCDVNIQRLDTMIFKARRMLQLGKILPEDADAKIRPLTKERKEFMDRMIEAMENLGIMPKNYIQKEPASATMAELHARYRKELDARRAKGWKVGTLDPEAHELVTQTGGVPENYSAAGVLSDEARMDIESKKDSEQPRP